MRYLINDSTDPYYNMAFDQWCLEHPICDAPVFYLWQNRPAVIIGLNQNAWNEVNTTYLREHDIALVRRVTGGGAVYHDLQNLNYTIVGRSADLDRDYPLYTSMIARALCTMGVDARLSGRNDIMVGGLKVSGFAKRVWKDRLMVHGTLMYDVDIETLTKVLDTPGSKMHAKGIASVRARVGNLRDCLHSVRSVSELKEGLCDILAGGDSPIRTSPGQAREVENLAQDRFRSWEWNWGHSPKGDLERSAILPCGSVHVNISLENGLVSDISLSGDYIGSLPSDAVCSILKGCRYERNSILGRLSAVPVAAYFENTSVEQLSNAII